MRISPSKGLGGGAPMRGIHPRPFGHFKSPSFQLDAIKEQQENLAAMILPTIEKRKLNDMIDDATNPFKVETKTDRLLVWREK